MKKYLTIAIIGFSLMACQNKEQQNTEVNNSGNLQVQRFGSITGLKADKLAYYEHLHANIWPGVLKKIKECNIRNYSIYVQKIDTSYYLFSYYEYVGKDYKKDMAKMAADSTTQRWWKETDPCQIPLPEAAAKSANWANMKEVFHAD
jgi:L-rhamnose mutarotase